MQVGLECFRVVSVEVSSVRTVVLTSLGWASRTRTKLKTNQVQSGSTICQIRVDKKSFYKKKRRL